MSDVRSNAAGCIDLDKGPRATQQSTTGHRPLAETGPSFGYVVSYGRDKSSDVDGGVGFAAGGRSRSGPEGRPPAKHWPASEPRTANDGAPFGLRMSSAGRLEVGSAAEDDFPT